MSRKIFQPRHQHCLSTTSPGRWSLKQRKVQGPRRQCRPSSWVQQANMFQDGLSMSWTEKENRSSLFIYVILFFLESFMISSFHLTKLGIKRRICLGCLLFHAFFMLVFSSKARLHNELVHLPIGGLLWTERDAVGLWLPGEIRDLWILQHLAVPARMMPAAHAFPSWLSAPVTFSLLICKACSWILDYIPNTSITSRVGRETWIQLWVILMKTRWAAGPPSNFMKP